MGETSLAQTAGGNSHSTLRITGVSGGKCIDLNFSIHLKNMHNKYSGPSLIRIALIRNLANPKSKTS